MNVKTKINVSQSGGTGTDLLQNNLLYNCAAYDIRPTWNRMYTEIKNIQFQHWGTQVDVNWPNNTTMNIWVRMNES